MTKPKQKQSSSEPIQLLKILLLNYSFVFITIKIAEAISNQTFDEIYISNKLLFFFCVFLMAVFIIFVFKITTPKDY